MSLKRAVVGGAQGFVDIGGWRAGVIAKELGTRPRLAGGAVCGPADQSRNGVLSGITKPCESEPGKFPAGPLGMRV
jgi:hypothetical protein